MPRDPSIAVIVLCAALAGTGCTFNTRGLPTDDGGAGINWYRDGAIWPDGSLQLDFGQPSPACKSPCPLGCFDAKKRCYRIKPSNFHALTSDKWFDAMTADVAPTSGLLIFNTDTGEVTASGVQRRPPDSKGQAQSGIYYNLLTMPPGHHPLGVFGINSLTVTKPVRMEIKGKAAFALYVRGNVVIDGEVVAGPAGDKPGAGGFAGGTVAGGVGGSCVLGGHGRGGVSFKRSNADPGGGGGGRRRPGGAGGSSQKSVGAAGGLAVGSAAAPIFGGCGGGAGGGQEGGHGGGGGGAIQITANGTIVIEGKVNAPGAGGGSGAGTGGGGGGGSGGAILLEAFGVQVNGFIAANGGGGGGGGGEGVAGQISPVPATGGKASTYVGGGGNGGAYNIEQGGVGKAAYNGGGGGGAAGQIWIHANAILFSGPNASPQPVQETSGVATW